MCARARVSACVFGFLCNLIYLTSATTYIQTCVHVDVCVRICLPACMVYMYAYGRIRKLIAS